MRSTRRTSTSTPTRLDVRIPARTPAASRRAWTSTAAERPEAPGVVAAARAGYGARGPTLRLRGHDGSHRARLDIRRPRAGPPPLRALEARSRPAREVHEGADVP